MSEARAIPIDSTPPLWRIFLGSLRPGGSSARGGTNVDDVPEIHLRRFEMRADRVAAYREMCGFPRSGAPTAGEVPVPLTYFFVAGFLPQAMLATRPELPVRALGMVHVSNTFELLRPVHPGDMVEIRCRVLGMETVAKGREVEVETLFLRDGETVARTVSESFARGGGHGREGEKKPRREPPPGEPVERWHLASDTGRRYAQVSGDYNPIHLHPWTARPLGFRRPIAHGMYLVARAVAAIESRSGGEPLDRLSVRFKTPTFLPGEPRLYLGRDGERHTFELWSADGRPHVVGEGSSGAVR